MPFLETALALVALVVALLMRPWRLLASSRPLVTQSHGDISPLWTPLLATLVILPWLWALPTLHKMPLQLQWSGACLVTLTLGWPLAVPVLLAVGTIACLLSPGLEAEAALKLSVWRSGADHLAMLWVRCCAAFWAPRCLFIFGRGFIGTVLCCSAPVCWPRWRAAAGRASELGKIARGSWPGACRHHRHDGRRITSPTAVAGHLVGRSVLYNKG